MTNRSYFQREDRIAPDILLRAWEHFIHGDYTMDKRCMVYGSDVVSFRLVRGPQRRSGNDTCRFEGEGWFISFTHRYRRSGRGATISNPTLWVAGKNQFDHDWALALLAV